MNYKAGDTVLYNILFSGWLTQQNDAGERQQ